MKMFKPLALAIAVLAILGLLAATSPPAGADPAGSHVSQTNLSNGHPALQLEVDYIGSGNHYAWNLLALDPGASYSLGDSCNGCTMSVGTLSGPSGEETTANLTISVDQDVPHSYYVLVRPVVDGQNGDWEVHGPFTTQKVGGSCSGTWCVHGLQMSW